MAKWEVLYSEADGEILESGYVALSPSAGQAVVQGEGALPTRRTHHVVAGELVKRPTPLPPPGPTDPAKRIWAILEARDAAALDKKFDAAVDEVGLGEVVRGLVHVMWWGRRAAGS